MKKIIITFTFTLLVAVTALAQKDQDADTLLWNGRRYAVTVDWNVPSVVQVYYQRTDSPMPFQSWSSNNNRGHVATLELMGDKLCLDSIEAKRYRTRRGNLWTESGIDTVVSPDYFDIKPINDSLHRDGDAVVADWFSGVLLVSAISSDKYKNSDIRLIHVVEGTILDNMAMNAIELKMIEKEPDDSRSKALHNLMTLRQQYITFYLRCSLDREHVVYEGHEGLFDHRDNRLSVIMDLLGNDPRSLFERSNGYGIGAPVGSYVIRNDSVFITELTLHSGSDLYSYSSRIVYLPDFLADSITHDGMVYGHRKMESDASFFADWMNGDYVIHYGQWDTNSYGVPDYAVSKTHKIRVRNGRVMHSQFSPRSFEEDEQALANETFKPCNGNAVYAVDDKQMAESVGLFKAPKKNPEYGSGKTDLRNYFLNKPLTDARAKERLFRVRIAFMVNCNGETGQFQVINKSKGELFEFANMVMDIVKEMPQQWKPATDKKGNAVDCWQILEFTVSNGVLTNANYK